MTNRFIISLTTIVLLLTSSFITVYADTEVFSTSPVKIYVDNSILESDVDPVIINGTTFVPMRSIFEKLGLNVDWIDSRKEAVAKSDDVEITLKIGSKTAILGETVENLLQAPFIEDGRTMMPVRFISESFGYNVEWDGTKREIHINSPSNVDNDSSAINELTYDEAIANAIKKSINVKNAELAYDVAERKGDEFDWLYSNVNSFTVWQNLKDLRLYKNWAEKQIVLTEEQTAYSVVSAMDQISAKMIEIDRKNDYLKYLQKTVDRELLLYENGVASYKDYITAKADYSSAEIELEALETELDGLYTKLNNILCENDSNRAVPQYINTYESVSDVNLDSIIRSGLDSDPYIWYVCQKKDSADFKLLTYEFNTGGKSYTLTSMDVVSAELDVDQIKQKYENVIRSRYNSLLQIESSIRTLEEKISVLRENIDTLRSSYDAGLITKNQIESLLQTKADLEMNVKLLESQHSLAKMLFDKPYLAPEYMTSA